jgi:hypothetical protein
VKLGFDIEHGRECLVTLQLPQSLSSLTCRVGIGMILKGGYLCSAS